MSKLSKKLRFYRESCGLSQFQIATVLNIDRSTYTYYETGKTMPSANTIIKLSRLFGVPYSEFFDCVGQELFDDEELQDIVTIQEKKGKNDEVDSKIFDLRNDEQDIILKYRLMSNENKEKLLNMLSELK